MVSAIGREPRLGSSNSAPANAHDQLPSVRRLSALAPATRAAKASQTVIIVEQPPAVAAGSLIGRTRSVSRSLYQAAQHYARRQLTPPPCQIPGGDFDDELLADVGDASSTSWRLGVRVMRPSGASWLLVSSRKSGMRMEPFLASVSRAIFKLPSRAFTLIDVARLQRACCGMSHFTPLTRMCPWATIWRAELRLTANPSRWTTLSKRRSRIESNCSPVFPTALVARA